MHVRDVDINCHFESTSTNLMYQLSNLRDWVSNEAYTHATHFLIPFDQSVADTSCSDRYTWRRLQVACPRHTQSVERFSQS
ncbi:hypothetical protein RRG08_018386 [Elysia crispata]|uniref:Uncharacterized protein n=1 Tax=Elysia crispata TaxID=231223 RepID=A0AAE1D1K7_9GAST|nr:hypothetical protein RRG08_018386 [Elysia crispata]